MAHIVMTDDGIEFDADALDTGPLVSLETSHRNLKIAPGETRTNATRT